MKQKVWIAALYCVGNGKGGESIYGGYFKGKSKYVFADSLFSSEINKSWFPNYLMKTGPLIDHPLHETNVAWEFLLCAWLSDNFLLLIFNLNWQLIKANIIG